MGAKTPLLLAASEGQAAIVRDHYVSTVCVAMFGVLLAVLPLAPPNPCVGCVPGPKKLLHHLIVAPYLMRIDNNDTCHVAGMRRTRKREATTPLRRSRWLHGQKVDQTD
ncbi:uncharacterized protein ACA1_077070 [Acanthamoeba castellanii str. Neff]|uniref:Uncharacterized protein n=1 Tax=Acanthamoeba castellanii (strain ATCC 30010 / Neff) TaxID=1257118 RepID=L8GM72_ACACF|nr:uncharacterized protein ACA1_077070 [Acanthamoeba castellanii str. Neff]ELR13853.1 hypothetical protein ACA1_077070 [Acanthamoeba castellanii str. Neff]